MIVSPRVRKLLGIEELRLHIGCGQVSLPGWVNVDNMPYPGVDHVLDVSKGLPFEAVDYIFAEHFIEHLAYDDALFFLRECRRVLGQNGILRMSTPNLDWVWMTHYHPGDWKNPGEALKDCFAMNRAFRGWGHQFLYNRQTLEATLREAGFGTFTPCRYGESQHEPLRGLEKHETWEDTADLPHVLVVEASGFASSSDETVTTPLADYRQAIGVK